MTPTEFRAIRVALHLRQIDVGPRIGRSHYMVREYESGRSIIPETVAQRMMTLDVPQPVSADELLAIRKRLGMTQGELGDAIGTVQPRISAWERGEYPVSSQAARCLRALVAGAEFDKMPPPVRREPAASVWPDALCPDCLLPAARGLPCGCARWGWA